MFQRKKYFHALVISLMLPATLLSEAQAQQPFILAPPIQQQPRIYFPNPCGGYSDEWSQKCRRDADGNMIDTRTGNVYHRRTGKLIRRGNGGDPPTKDSQFVENSSGENSFGAIAFSQRAGRLGWSWGHDSQSKAESVAIRSCKASDCKSIDWFQDSYGAMVIADDRSWGFSTGHTSGKASLGAFENCKKYAKNPRTCSLRVVVHSENGVTYQKRY